MSIVDTLVDWRKQSGLSQREIAERLHLDPSYISKIEGKNRKWPESLDANLAKMDWRLAIALIDERTGGWIHNRFGELDPHPAAIKEQLLKELQEAYSALGAIMMGNHVDREKQRENAKQVQKEIRDVLEVGLIMYGVIGEVFGLDGSDKSTAMAMRKTKQR